MASFPRTLLPFEVTSLEMPGPLVSKAQSGKVNIRTTQQVGRSWTERYLLNTRSVDGRALLAAVSDYWRNGTIFTIDHRDHVTPLGTGGGSPLINAATQLVTDPENLGAWTLSSSPVLTAGQSDPLGGTAAYLIDDDSAGAFESIHQNVGFTGDGEKAFSVYARQGSSAGSWFRLRDNTAGVDRHLVSVSWSGGVPTLATSGGAGSRFTPEAIGPLWWRLSASATGIVAANTNWIELAPAAVSGAAAMGTTYFFGANAWNELTPARYAGPSQAAGTTGAAIYLNGGTASVSNWLRAGDILAIAGISAIREVTATVSTQANGYVVVPVNPPLFTGGSPADNAVVTITGVTMNACILEPPTFPTTSGSSNDYGELTVRFSESL